MVGRGSWAPRSKCLGWLIVIGFVLSIHPALDASAVSERDRIEDVVGTVVKVGNLGYALVPDEDPGTRYVPTEPLTGSFQVDGLRVRFSGEIGDPSDIKGRRWGTPFKVTHIEILESSGT